MANKPTVISIKVHFELITTDKLRRVIFGLEKDTKGNQINWTINFKLFERDQKSDPWDTDPMIDLEVEVDTVLNPKAEQTALKGMTPGQEAHALGPAAEDAKAAEEGELDQSEANATVLNTLKKK
jgi:hypothetical protein